MKTLSKQAMFIGFVLASGSLASCGGVESTDIGPDSENLEAGETRLLVGDYTNLSATELEEFKEDRRYLRSLVGPNTAVHLNLADPQQYRLAKARLKISGKSRANAPHLMATLERTRQDHVLRGYGKGLVAEVSFRSGEADRQEMHFISTATVDGERGEGAASSTIPDGSAYTMLDVGYYDDDGVPLGLPNIVEQFAAGTDVNIQTDADLSASTRDAYLVDSLKFEDTGTDFVVSYVYTDMGLQGAAPPNRPAPPSVVVQSVLAPVDVANNDGLISICLNRVWTGDCDYDLTGNPQSIKVPLQGTIEITSAAHVFSQSAIDDIKADPNNNPRAGYVKLLLSQVGGGCDVTSTEGALQSSMEAFWNSVVVSPNQKTLSWDLTGANAAFFDDGCRQVQDAAFLTMRLQLPVRDTVFNLDYWVSKTLSNNPDQFAPDFVYDPIKITNSCLAAGTEIQMADGSLVPVEELSSGAHVFNSTHDGAKGLTVTDTAVGFEPEPMVRLEADSGHSVLMTEMHPVQTPDRGIVLAKDLREGDLVITMSGVSALSRVGREEFDGKVYNLKLGTDMEKAALLAEDKTLVYANGFLVGDGQVQSKYESLALEAPMQGDVLDRLPTEWHLDYQLSPLRNRNN